MSTYQKCIKSWGEAGRSPLSIRSEIGNVPSVPGFLGFLKIDREGEELLDRYSAEFAQFVLAALPPSDKPTA